MDYRIEHDSMGEVRVPSDAMYSAQTQRSLNNFHIGSEKMPYEMIKALVNIKKACAKVSFLIDAGDDDPMYDQKIKKGNAIIKACDEILLNGYEDQFPLSVWQTGSGTQTNMNVNEVISFLANRILTEDGSDIKVHPNDDVNKSQSTNDVFPSAICIAAADLIENTLFDRIDRLISELKRLEGENHDVIKAGRTHLQDATPVRFSQEISGWRTSLEYSKKMIEYSLIEVKKLPVGGTAVGTGINARERFDCEVTEVLSNIYSIGFIPDNNKFHGLSSKDTLVFCHGALKTLACDLFKIASDIRLLSCGPRTGFSEITLPSNEPGSSIMPGKVNPTQCEALIMVCMQVMGNDSSVSAAGASGILELNVCMPLIAYNMIQSVRLLSDAVESFTENCVKGIIVNKEKMRENLSKSLMNATILNPVIGYENVAKVVKKAFDENLTLKEACVKLGCLDEEEFDKVYDLNKMV